MAEALCRDEIARLLKVDLDSLESQGIRVLSAGLAASPGTPLKSVARQALDELGAGSSDHVSQNLSDDMIRNADRIICMTKQQQRLLVERYPQAATRICCLDPDTDVEEPLESSLEHYVDLGRKIQVRLRKWLQQDEEFVLLGGESSAT